MSKLLKLFFVVFFLFPAISKAENIKVAFIRDGFVWTKINSKEEKVTEEKGTFPYPPQWSYDGRIILYQKEAPGSKNQYGGSQNEIWVYDTETKEHKKIYFDGYNPKWSPVENIIAFQSGGVLNISDQLNFYNVSLGVGDYVWKPDGKGFIASSNSAPLPSGWTNPIIYTISIENGYKNITSLSDHVKELFVVPSEVTKGDVSVKAIGTQFLDISPNGKWISFVVTPWASWSMDSDMLCVLSSDGKNFEVLDELILHLTPPSWASSKNLLAYIAGGGRIVYGFKNKKLKVTELPVTQTITLTPKDYAELGFTWIEDSSFVVSRVPEAEWSNEPEERPKPALYHVSLDGGEQKKISSPPKNLGDHQPEYLPSIDKITWLRKSDIAYDGDLWIADLDGKNPKLWIKKVEGYDFYPK